MKRTVIWADSLEVRSDNESESSVNEYICDGGCRLLRYYKLAIVLLWYGDWVYLSNQEWNFNYWGEMDNDVYGNRGLGM